MKAWPETVGLDLRGAPLGALVEGVGDDVDAGLDVVAQGEGLGVGGAEDDGAAGRDVADVATKRFLHGLVGAVVVEVVGLDVGDERDLRVVAEEGAIVLVGLDDDVRAVAGRGVGAEVGDFGADQVGRVAAGRDEDVGDEAAGRALAVAAGDADADLALHEARDHLGALDHGDAALAGGDELRVVADRGRGGDDEVGVADVGGGVRADDDARAERLQRVGEGRAAQVGAGDFGAPGEQDAADGGHVHAADAHEVDALRDEGGAVSTPG